MMHDRVSNSAKPPFFFSGKLSLHRAPKGEQKYYFKQSFLYPLAPIGLNRLSRSTANPDPVRLTGNSL